MLHVNLIRRFAKRLSRIHAPNRCRSSRRFIRQLMKLGQNSAPRRSLHWRLPERQPQSVPRALNLFTEWRPRTDLTCAAIQIFSMGHDAIVLCQRADESHRPKSAAQPVRALRRAAGEETPVSGFPAFDQRKALTFRPCARETIALAARPSVWTLDGLPTTSIAAIIAARASGRRGAVAFQSR